MATLAEPPELQAKYLGKVLAYSCEISIAVSEDCS
jgi:hypothetical protein